LHKNPLTHAQMLLNAINQKNNSKLQDLKYTKKLY